jgi:hypothetical protein
MTRLESVLAKYHWAKKHVDNFDAAVADFRRTNPHAIRKKCNLEAGSVTYYVESVPDIDPELAMRFGDAVHNLRSTLDHLARALVEATGAPFDPKNTSFPICNFAKDYKSRARASVVGIGKTSREILDRIEPYKGGTSHHLWQLNELDVIDKHRMLVAVATVPIGHSMTPIEKAAFKAKKPIIGPTTFAIRQYIFAASNPGVIPLQAGQELGTFPVSESDNDVGFAFDVAINEFEVVDGLVPASYFLMQIKSEVGTIIGNFAPYLLTRLLALSRRHRVWRIGCYYPSGYHCAQRAVTDPPILPNPVQPFTDR